MRRGGAGKRESADDAARDELETPADVTRWEGEGGAPTAVGAPKPAGDEAEKGAAGEPASDFRDRWLRAEAELQNFKRRAQRDADEARRGAEERVLLDLAALLEDLERALQAAQEGGANPAWAEGVKLVLQKGRDYLGRHGLIVVDPLGEPFDPNHHEAILEVDAAADVPPGTVVQVAQKGYRRDERPLRVARVVVSRTQPSS